MADLTTTPTVLNFRDDTDRAASCLAALQRVLRDHRFTIDVSEWLSFASTAGPQDSPALWDSRSTDWLGEGGMSLDSQAIHSLARDRLRDEVGFSAC